jgi:hypothetical protein
MARKAREGAVNILGYTYTLKRGATVDEMGAMGRMIPGALTILIACDLTRQQSESTVIHEVIEAVNHALDLGLQHNQISGIEVALYGALTAAGVDLSPLVEGVG